MLYNTCYIDKAYLYYDLACDDPSALSVLSLPHKYHRYVVSVYDPRDVRGAPLDLQICMRTQGNGKSIYLVSKRIIHEIIHNIKVLFFCF